MFILDSALCLYGISTIGNEICLVWYIKFTIRLTNGSTKEKKSHEC